MFQLIKPVRWKGQVLYIAFWHTSPVQCVLVVYC